MLNYQSGTLTPSHVNNKDDGKKNNYYLTKLLSQSYHKKTDEQLISQNQQGDYFEFTAHSSLLSVCSLPHLPSDSSVDGWR